MMGKTSSAILATTLLASSAMAWAPAADQEVCQVVTYTVTGDPVLVGVEPTWGDWTVSTTSTKAAVTTTTSVDPTWVDWASSSTTTTVKSVKPTTTTSVDPTWIDWESSSTTTTTTKPVKPTTTTSVDPTWLDWDSSSSTTTTTTTTTVAASTTKAPVWTSTSAATSAATSAVTTKPTTTTDAPVAKPTCPSDNGKTLKAGGSCNCDYTVNCGVHAVPDSATTTFWQQHDALVPTLAECLALCDNNSQCEKALWVDDASSGDYHRCWQIKGNLGEAQAGGVAQISYKGACSGSCSSSYAQVS